MSYPDYIQLELKASKKKLHFELGQLVVPIQEPDIKPFCVSGFLPIGSYHNHNADYQLKKLTRKGKIKCIELEQNEIKAYQL